MAQNYQVTENLTYACAMNEECLQVRSILQDQKSLRYAILFLFRKKEYYKTLMNTKVDRTHFQYIPEIS